MDINMRVISKIFRVSKSVLGQLYVDIWRGIAKCYHILNATMRA